MGARQKCLVTPHSEDIPTNFFNARIFRLVRTEIVDCATSQRYLEELWSRQRQ